MTPRNIWEERCDDLTDKLFLLQKEVGRLRGIPGHIQILLKQGNELLVKGECSTCSDYVRDCMDEFVRLLGEEYKEAK